LAANPLKVADEELPVMVVFPTDSVTVHEVVGNPLNATLPVAVVQVGCVIAPTVGALGVVGWAFNTALTEAEDVQVPLLTVKV
jgi:hypothetical protein